MNLSFIFKKKSEPEVRSAPIGVDGWPSALPGTAQGYMASPYFAENLSTVYGCVQAISSALSSLPVFIYQKAGKTRQELSEGVVYGLVHGGPNQYQSWPDFIEFTVAQVLLFGNALIEWNGEELRPFPWSWVNVQMLSNGRMVYDVSEQPGVFGSTGRRRRLLDSDAIHIRDRSDDGVIGKSRLQRAAATLRIAQAVNQHTANLFDRGMSPSGILTTPQTLTDEAKAVIRQSFERYQGASNAGKLLLLPGPDFDLKMLHITPEDSELLASRKFTTEELCRIYMVPPPIVQDYSHNTFTNSEQAGKWFAQFCLLPWTRKLEAAFNKSLFPVGDCELAMDLSGFDRGDPATRWNSYAIAIDKGILTVDEVREQEGWSPMKSSQV